MGTKAGRDSRTQAPDALPGCTRRLDGIDLALHVQPGARRTALCGWHGDRLKVAVAAPATDGRANAAVIDLLAQALAVARREVTLV
ncbi:MAG: DUF167 domain-containing protein, partial [Burkholderiaceae bacterium]|nr:DUF167 domain-containing protein [Burkholderiaceae bacterium]